MSMGMVLLIAVCCLSVVYAALCSVIYMFGSGSVEISYKNLYYWVDTSTGKGNFYRSCTDGEVDKDSSTDFTTMAQAVNAIKNGGNIYMLSTYVPGEGESVSVNTKTITIQRYVSKTTTSAGVETIKAAFTDGPLFDVSTDFKIELAGTKPCLAINGNEVKSSAGAFKVSNGAKLTLNNSETTSITSEGNNGGIFTINENYCSLSIDSSDSNVLYGGGAIYALGGQVDAKNIRFEGNRSTNTGEAFGGAIYAANNGAVKSDISLENCSFTNNTARNLKLEEVKSNTYAWTGVAPAYGGAVCVKSSTVNMTQCTFTGNAVDVYKKNNIRATGGAVYIDSTSSGSMKDCTVESNQSSYCIRSGAGVCVEAGDNAFALSGKTIIKNNSCYFVDPDSNNGINANDNLYLSGDGSNISIDTSKISEGSNIFVNVNPEPAKNGDLKALISDDIHKASSADFFHSDIGGYKAQIENSSNYKGLYLVSSSEYDDLWYRVVSNVSTVTGYNYKSFFYKDKSGALQDTGLAHFVDAVASLNDNGTIHMQTIYNPSISETITLPGNKNVNVIRENDNDESYSRNSMFGIGNVTFTVNAADPSSSITFDGNKSNAGSVGADGGVFDVYGTSTFVLNGADKSTGDGKTITIKDSKISSYKGGGVRISSGSSSISNCAITGCESEGNNGGGIYYYVGDQDTATLKNCTITGNKASLGGGIYCDNTEDNLLLLGKVTIKGNTNGNGADDNLYFRISEYFNPTVTLTSSDSTLSDGSEIGVATSKSPEEGSPVKFASSATEAMKACFTPDVSDYVVRFASNENALYLAVPTYSELWYKADENDSNTKKFFEGSDVNNLVATDITKFSKAVQCLSASGKIHMLTTYESAADETTTVPASKNITVLREGTFKDASMFKITGGTFEIGAIDASSSITFDGQKITPTADYKGGAFYVDGGSINFNGADASNKNLTVQNFWSKGVGGAICFNKGTSTIKYCNFKGNKVTSTGIGCKGGAIFIETDSNNTHNISDCYFTENEALYSNGGAIRAENGTNSITNCYFESNKAKYGGALAFCNGTNTVTNCIMKSNATANKGSGGAIDDYNGKNTYTDCTIENNTCDGVEGGGFCVNNQGTNDSKITFAGKMVIINNTASGSKCNAYIIDNIIFTIASNFSTESQIGVTTHKTPTSSTPVKFAVNASADEMLGCFTSDKGYFVYKQGTELYLTRAPSDLYQSDNKFYLDAEKTKLTNIKTMAEAVKIATNIHMLSAYTASSDETVEVPSGKNVTVSRYSTFANDAMIRVNGGNLTVKATDTTSSITFDGQNVETTVTDAYGGIIHVAGTEGTSLTLTGADNNGTKTINFVNSFVKGPSAGGAIRNNGTATLTNCNISNNKASPTDGGSIAGGVSNFGTLTMESCLVNGNSTTGNMSGGIYAGSNAIKSTIKNCQVTNNSAKLYGGGIFLSGGGSDNSGSPVSIIEDCTVTGNTVGDSTATPAVNGYGAGIYIGAGANGTSTISRTTISENNAAGGGGLYISDGRNTITSCTITKNQKSSWGGGVRIDGGTNKFEGCSVINNEASSRGGGFYLTKAGSTTLTRCTISGNIAPDQGGAGIFFTKNADGTAGTLALSGAMSITGNNSKDSTDENNLWIGDGLTIDVSGLATEGSAIGILTENNPTLGNDLQFATNATEEMKACFTHDPDTSEVVYKDGGLYLRYIQPLYYSTKSGSGLFYNDEACTNATSYTKLTEAVDSITSKCNIFMMSQYASSADEETNVTAGKSIKVIRYKDFKDASMFKITGGTFKVNATDATSSITFDGKKIEITVKQGGAFYVKGGNLNLNGVEKSSGGKTIAVENNVISPSSYAYGGGIYVSGGTNTLTNCSITGNKVSASSSSTYGGGIYVSGGTNTLENCSITKNTAFSSSSASGGGVYIYSGTNTLTNCSITDNTASTTSYSAYGGGVYIYSGTNTLTNCSITDNTASASSSAASASSAYGGGVHIAGGTNTLENCSITKNTAFSSSSSASGGGVYLGGGGTNTLTNCSIIKNTASTTSYSAYGGGGYLNTGTNTLTNCSITGNTVSASTSYTSSAYGGGFYINNGTNTLENCSITGNTVSSTLVAYGGGVCIWNGTNTLLGTMNITGNTAVAGSDSSNSNLHLRSSYKVALSDSSGGTLSTDSRIGVTTGTSPTVDAPIQFATSASEEMVDYFTPDEAERYVTYEDGKLYLRYGYGVFYYKDGKFYGDEACTYDTGLTKLSEAVNSISSPGRIYIMSQYASSADETVDVPAGKSVQVIRHKSFTDASMFSITGGTFTVNATDATSLITFDGKKIETTVKEGGAFYVDGGNINFNGAEKTVESKKEKTIVIKDNIISLSSDTSTSSAYGGGVYINRGTNTLTNCSITGNKVSASSTTKDTYAYGGGVNISNGKNTLTNCNITGNTVSASATTKNPYAYGGGVCIWDGTNTLENCSITSNTVSATTTSSSAADARGGGVYIYSGTNTLTNCSITDNTASASSSAASASSAYGGGVHIAGGTNTLENCSITGNTVSSTLVAYGGGVCIWNGTNTLLGTMNITGNTAVAGSDSSDNNLYLRSGYTVALSDSSGGTLSADSHIGVTTQASAPAKFATGVTDDIAAVRFCFDDDKKANEVYRIGTELYLGKDSSVTYEKYDNLYYYRTTTGDNNDGLFYTDSSHKNSAGIKLLSEAVGHLNKGGNIYFLTSYTTLTTGERVVAPPDMGEIHIIRYSSSGTTFDGESMININGLFEVTCPHTNSTIIFDGNNVSTKDTGAGILWLWQTGSARIIGASPSCKNIKFVNSIITTGGGAAIRLGGGDNVIKNCIIEGNKRTSTDSEGSGAVLLLENDSHANSTSMENCDLINNTSAGNAGALYVASGTHSFTNCNITNNQGFGGGSYINGGTNSFTGCKISNNTSVKVGSIEPYGGGLYINKGTNYFLNCEINGNKAHNGGGLISKSATNTFEKCTVSGNVIDDYGNGLCLDGSSNTIIDCTITDNKGASHGAGIWVGGGTVNIYGNTVVKNNVLNDGTTENNVEVGGGCTVALSDGSGNALSTDSQIGVTTNTAPTVDTPVQFATSATEEMKACFTPDEAKRYVTYEDGKLYLRYGYVDLYYKNGTFYTDEACSSSSGLTKFSEAVSNIALKGGTIHMMSQYASSADETVTVPAGANITVARHSSFTTDSMFKITGGTFKVNATDATSSITFDGKSLTATANFNGGAFDVGGDSGKLELNGASDSTRNIILQNNRANKGAVWDSITNHGGAIYVESQGGGVTCNNCVMKGNASSMRGGAVCVVTGTNSFKNCTMDSNSKPYYGGAFASFGIDGMAKVVNTLENCSFTNNASIDYGGNLLLDDGTTTFTNCTVSGGSTRQKGSGVYCTGATATFEGCSIKNNTGSSYGGGINFLRTNTSNIKVSNTEISGNTASSKGGGIYVEIYNNETKGKLTLTGATKITGNKVSSSANNVYIVKNQLIDVTGLATEQGAIGVKTAATPTAGTPVQFATGASEEMVDYFTPDEAERCVTYEDGKLYLNYGYNKAFYYKDGTFYTDEACSNSSGLTKLSKAVDSISSLGTIHMMSQYASSADEETNVTAGKNIRVIRYKDFKDASMFKITGGTFTVNATDATSSITFDGQKIETAVEQGGAFNVDGGSINFNGADKSGGGKTIAIENNIISRSSDTSDVYAYGGGVYINSGANTLSNCSITGNKVSSTSTSTSTSAYVYASAYAYGGGVYTTGSGTNTLENCSITGNTASASSDDAASDSSGGGVCIYSGTNTLTNCSITGNTASASSDASPSAGGGGVYIESSGTNTLENCSITGNTASASSDASITMNAYAEGGGVYTTGSGTNTLENCSITGNTASSSTSSAYGGGVNVEGSGTNTLSDCNITENTASSSTSVYGGGVCNHTNTTLLGTMNIVGNTAKVGSDSSDNNLQSYSTKTVALSSGSKYLSTSSNIGVTTGTKPTSGNSIKFATGATSAMASCFTPDDSSYNVAYGSSGTLSLAVDNERQITLSSSTPSIRITPEGYYTPQTSTTLNSFTGTYVLTGSYKGTSSSKNPDVVFENTSTERKTIKVKIKDLSLEAYTWCSLGLLEGNGPMDIYITAEGTNSLQGYNHPAFNINSDKVQGSNMYLNVKSGSTLLGSTNKEAPRRVAADGINFYFNGTLLTSEQKNKNTTFTSTGYTQ